MALSPHQPEVKIGVDVAGDPGSSWMTQDQSPTSGHSERNSGRPPASHRKLNKRKPPVTVTLGDQSIKTEPMDHSLADDDFDLVESVESSEGRTVMKCEFGDSDNCPVDSQEQANLEQCGVQPWNDSSKARTFPPENSVSAAIRVAVQNEQELDEQLSSTSQTPGYGQEPFACENCKPYLEAILKGQAQIIAALKQQEMETQWLKSAMIKLLSTRRGKNEEDFRPDLPSGYSYPLQTVAQLEWLNEQLADPSAFRCTVAYLNNLGGDSYKACLRAAGAALLSPALQGQYNFTGNNKSGQNKRAFCKLHRIVQVMFEAVIQRFPEMTKTWMNAFISDWLATWRDRVPGGRMRRGKWVQLKSSQLTLQPVEETCREETRKRKSDSDEQRETESSVPNFL